MSFGDRMREMFGGKGHQREWAEDARFRERHLASGSRDDYERVRPAYQYGYFAGSDESYRGHSFDEVESHLRTHWNDDLTQRSGAWEHVRPHVHAAYREAQETVVTRSEEELAIGKRQVSAGEVEVNKSVETRHVSQRVPVTREEVVVERRPVNEARAAGTDIGDDAIRIPITEEELVVEKRPVVREEIVVRKQVVQDTRTVEADLRRERVDVDDRSSAHLGAHAGRDASTSGAADRATSTGPGDRLADKADNLKDRIDGNPASKPGPDATDRRI